MRYFCLFLCAALLLSCKKEESKTDTIESTIDSTAITAPDITPEKRSKLELLTDEFTKLKQKVFGPGIVIARRS